MDYGRKRKLTFITIGLLFLLSGVEYAVILPTIWRFLQTLDAAPYFLGLSLSAFSLSGLLSGPLFGLWSDRIRSTKKIILFANCFEIIGNFMYFTGFSKWLLLSSRFVAGIGTGAGSSVFGFLTRITAPEDRSTVFAAVMACRQAGLLIGPAFNIFLRLCDFQLGPFMVNKYTAPGIFMCLLWLLLQLIVLLMYWDLRGRNEGSEENKQAEEERLLVQPNDVPESYGTLHNSPVMEQSIANNNFTPPCPPFEEIHSNPFKHFSAARDEEQPHLSTTSSPVKRRKKTVTKTRDDDDDGEAEEQCVTVRRPPERKETRGGNDDEFLREEVVVLLTAQFITLFNQTALETMVTPLTQQYFNFGELENSVMYCVCGLEVIAGFFFVRWISRKVEERVVLSIGLFLANISCVWCLIFLANPQGGFSWQLTEFIVGVFLQVLGLPFIAVAQVSLFSKVTAEKTQGFNQGIRRSVGGLATILGPLWAGTLTSNLYVMLGVMMGLLVLLTIMMAFSYKSLINHTTLEPTEE